jgi:hypothetical protein
LAHNTPFLQLIAGEGGEILERATTGGQRQPAAGPEFDLTKAWADSRHDPARVHQAWRALYRGYGVARQQFPDVDWISLIAILAVIAVARAHGRRVDISYLAEEMSWPRTTALRRLRKYDGSGYLVLSREGRHTYVDNTLQCRRVALKMIDVVIESIDRGVGPRPIDGRHETSASVTQFGPPRRHPPGPTHPVRRARRIF